MQSFQVTPIKTTKKENSCLETVSLKVSKIHNCMHFTFNTEVIPIDDSIWIFYFCKNYSISNSYANTIYEYLSDCFNRKAPIKLDIAVMTAVALFGVQIEVKVDENAKTITFILLSSPSIS